MRIWSLHPRYLDAKGLVALWREALLAKKVLEGKTRGYRNHPQLIRFRRMAEPVGSINKYLSCVYEEAVSRAYDFNRNKINWNFNRVTIPVTEGQVQYEFNHLLNKLKTRDIVRYKEICNEQNIMTNPIFKITEGDIEGWEVV